MPTNTFNVPPNRRDFLYAGAAPALAMPALAERKSLPKADVRCIFLILVGGPSQIDTFDPKPEAPAEIRGPFRSVPTNVPGIRISEILPRTARQFDKVSVIRTLHHDAPAVHETGLQLIQSGRLASGGVEHPSMGCVVDSRNRSRSEFPVHMLLPGPIGRTGADLSNGQGPGCLGREFAPRYEGTGVLRAAFDLSNEPAKVRKGYGRTRFGGRCLAARRLIEAGVLFVTVNMFDTVFDTVSWDAHGRKPFSTLRDMASIVAPAFDRAYSALLEDLSDRGLLSSTIVVAAGEFGRTPKINADGGRDHHTGVWSVLIGGGPIQPGRIVGESDQTGSVPRTRPVTCAELCATIYQGMGIDPHATLPGPDGRPIPLTDKHVRPVSELF